MNDFWWKDLGALNRIHYYINYAGRKKTAPDFFSQKPTRYMAQKRKQGEKAIQAGWNWNHIRMKLGTKTDEFFKQLFQILKKIEFIRGLLYGYPTKFRLLHLHQLVNLMPKIHKKSHKSLNLWDFSVRCPVLSVTFSGERGSRTCTISKYHTIANAY